jgi:hypothetical protein
MHKNFYDTVENLSPNVKRFQILVFRPHFFDEVTSNLVCRWTNFLVVECPNVALNADAILHLPHLYPNMTVVEAEHWSTRSDLPF